MCHRGITLVAGAVLAFAIVPANGLFAIVIFVATVVIGMYPYKDGKVLP